MHDRDRIEIMDTVEAACVDRSAFEVADLGEDSETAYWLAKSPADRMEALEFMRQIIYGYDQVTCRLQRVLEVAELE